jgi:hypothetical protein
VTGFSRRSVPASDQNFFCRFKSWPQIAAICCTICDNFVWAFKNSPQTRAIRSTSFYSGLEHMVEGTCARCLPMFPLLSLNTRISSLLPPNEKDRPIPEFMCWLCGSQISMRPTLRDDHFTSSASLHNSPFRMDRYLVHISRCGDAYVYKIKISGHSQINLAI